jgi:hypothetical protein
MLTPRSPKGERMLDAGNVMRDAQQGIGIPYAPFGPAEWNEREITILPGSAGVGRSDGREQFYRQESLLNPALQKCSRRSALHTRVKFRFPQEADSTRNSVLSLIGRAR